MPDAPTLDHPCFYCKTVTKDHYPDCSIVLQARISDAVNRIDQSGGIDGAHHKQWVLNQVLCILLSAKEYQAFVARRIADGYDWDEGIAP